MFSFEIIELNSGGFILYFRAKEKKVSIKLLTLFYH